MNQMLISSLKMLNLVIWSSILKSSVTKISYKQKAKLKVAELKVVTEADFKWYIFEGISMYFYVENTWK